MLIASLIASCVFLVAVNVTAFRSGSILRALPWCALGLAGYFLMVLLPAFMLQTALTLIAGLVCAWLAPRPRVFLPTTVGTFLIAYAVVGVPTWLAYEKLQRDLTPISVADRLSYEDRPLQVPDSSPLGADVRLISMPTSQPGFLENNWEGEGRSKYRVVALKSLHDHQVTAFVNSPGFGISRGTGMLQRAIQLPDEPPVPIDDSGSSIPPESAASLFAGGYAALDKATSPDLDNLHRSSAIDFVFPQGFGYVKDRNRVYGFRSHRFSKMPQSVSSWRFRRVELVSLLKHDKPMVYLSKNLPRMSELRHAATRPLDAFEAAALPRLAKDDLVIHSTDERLRVLGSIRAAEACLNCHAGKQGGLLGAFSYTLDRKTKE